MHDGVHILDSSLCCWQAGFNVTPEQSSLQVAVSEVAEGSLLQLHVEDAKWSQAGIRTCLQVCCD